MITHPNGIRDKERPQKCYVRKRVKLGMRASRRKRYSYLVVLMGLMLNCLQPNAKAHEDEKPAKTDRGLEIIYSSSAPKWIPAPMGSKLPKWMDVDTTYVSQPMVNISGGSNQQGSYADQWTINTTISSGLNIDDNRKKELDRWSLHANYGLQLGTPAFGDQISAEFPPQSIYYPQGFWLRGLYTERDGGNTKIRVGPGMTINNLFDSQTYNYYINSTIDNTLNLQLPGLPIDPYNSIGASIDWQPTKKITAKYGIFQLSQNRGLNTSHANIYKGWYLGASNQDGTVQGLKLEYAYKQAPLGLEVCLDHARDGIFQRVGRNCKKVGAVENNLPKPILQVGGYSATWAFPYLDGSDGIGSTTNGVFVHGTAPVTMPWGHGSSLWGSVVYNSNDLVNQTPITFMGGMISQGVLPKRPFDQMIIGFSRSSLSSYATYPNYTIGGEAQVFTAMAELDYSIKLNSRLSIQPGIQFIFNPSGNDNYNTAVIPQVQFMLGL